MVEADRFAEPKRDAGIEGRLFGRHVVDDPDSSRGVSVLWPDGTLRELPHYHRDIAAAWLIVERLRQLGLLGRPTLETEFLFFESEHYKGSAAEGYPKDCPPFLWLFDGSAPRIICKAALAVVAGDPPSTS
jgi:hypothetical protein